MCNNTIDYCNSHDVDSWYGYRIKENVYIANINKDWIGQLIIIYSGNDVNRILWGNSVFQ